MNHAASLPTVNKLEDFGTGWLSDRDTTSVLRADDILGRMSPKLGDLPSRTFKTLFHGGDDPAVVSGDAMSGPMEAVRQT